MAIKLEIDENVNRSYDDLNSESLELRSIIEQNYDKYIELKEEISIFNNQYQQLLEKCKVLESENILKQNEIIKLDSELNKSSDLIRSLEKKNMQIEDRLYALKNSKLGKINVAYWDFKNRKKEKTK